MKYIKKVLAVFFLLQMSVAVSQTLSVDELRSKIDERVSERDSYQALLNDPDPDRSLAALQIMLESGDATLSELALSQGLVSTSAKVRRATLESFLNSAPSLEFTIRAEKLEESELKNFAYQLRSATLTLDGAYLNYRVGAYDNGKGCWLYAKDKRDCMIRLSEESLSFYGFGKWSRLELNQEGVLKGKINIPKSSRAFDISVPVTN